MTADKEDIEYIENILNKCVKVKHNKIIYYVTSPNIIRQLKYNKVLKNKKDIVIDLTKISIKDNLMLIYNDSNNVAVNEKIMLHLEYKYYYEDISEIISNILSKLKLNSMCIGYINQFSFDEINLSELLKIDKYIIKIKKKVNIYKNIVKLFYIVKKYLIFLF